MVTGFESGCLELKWNVMFYDWKLVLNNVPNLLLLKVPVWYSNPRLCRLQTKIQIIRMIRNLIIPFHQKVSCARSIQESIYAIAFFPRFYFFLWSSASKIPTNYRRSNNRRHQYATCKRSASSIYMGRFSAHHPGRGMCFCRAKQWSATIRATIDKRFLNDFLSWATFDMTSNIIQRSLNTHPKPKMSWCISAYESIRYGQNIVALCRRFIKIGMRLCQYLHLDHKSIHLDHSMISKFRFRIIDCCFSKILYSKHTNVLSIQFTLIFYNAPPMPLARNSIA